MEPLAIISGYLRDAGLGREQRANSFAMRFLCPPSKLRVLRNSPSPQHAAVELGCYGLHYAALRLYLRNEASADLPAIPPPGLVGMGTEPKWSHAEEPIGIANFPLQEVPPARRTLIARTAARLYSEGRIRRGHLADALGVTPTADVERVLDFFALAQRRLERIS